MSGRIRTIKPEWLEDEKMCFASADARVMSIALILIADDHGNGRANPVWLNSQVFPGEVDMTRAARALDELVGIGFARRYGVGEQSYFAIRGWSKHQRIDRPSKPRVPLPPPESEQTREPCSIPREENESAREFVGNTREGQESPQNPGLDTSSRALQEPSRALSESSRSTNDQRPPTSDLDQRPTTTTDAHGAVVVVGSEPHKLTPAFAVPEDDWNVISALPIPEACHRVLIRWFVNHHLDGDSRTPAEWRRSFRLWATRAWNERRTECLAESKTQAQPATATGEFDWRAEKAASRAAEAARRANEVATFAQSTQLLKQRQRSSQGAPS